jgi:tetratricopeptide (TPR) repeat protein
MPKKRQRHSRLIKKWDGRSVAHPAAAAGRNTSLRVLRARLETDADDYVARLELAEALLARDHAGEVVDVLEGHVAKECFDDDQMNRWRAVRALGFALAKVDRYEDTRLLVESASASVPEALDYHYLLAYVNHHLGSDARCETHARAFLSFSDAAASDEAAAVLCSTRSRRHEVLNYLGLSLENTGRNNEAMAAFENAIEAKRSYDLAWANFVRLLAKVGRITDAQAVLREGRRSCPRSSLLARLTVADAPSEPAPPKITLCMIVKNEEEHLPQCLTSVRGLADQIIIVDTGSTDRTVEIAESFGATVYHHAWEGDFSKARNISMGYADGDWIFILDADEEVEAADVALVRQVAEQNEFKIVAVSVYNYSREKGMYTSFLPSIRLFRRDLGAYYEGIVHNQLRFHTAEPTLRIPARIYHYGYGLSPEAMVRKVARSRELLEKQLAENPDHAFAHFNLAQLLRGDPSDASPGRMDRVVHHATRAVELTSPDDVKQRHIHLMALHQLVTAYFTKGEYAKAAECAHRALRHKPGYLDAIISLGHIHSLDGQSGLARKYFLEYLEQQGNYNEHAETDHVIILHLDSRHNAYYGLGLVAELEDKPTEAVEWFEKCVAQRDDYLDGHFRLAQALSRIGDGPRSRQELERGLVVHGENLDMRLILADQLSEPGQCDALRSCLEEGLKHHPENGELRCRLARLELAQGKPDVALQHLEAVDNDTADRAVLLRLRADISYALQQWEAAGRLYEQCLESATDDPVLLNNLGNCHYQVGAHARAEAIYRRLIEAGKAESFVYRNLGLSLAQQEKIDDAIFSLESYAQMAPDDLQVCGVLGDLYAARHNYTRAIEEYEKLVEQEPGRPDTLTRLGDCYLHSGAVQSALMGYEAALQVDAEYQPAWDRLRAVREYLVERSTPPRSTVENNEPVAAGEVIDATRETVPAGDDR